MIYIGTPYHHDNPAVMHQRFELVTQFAGRLLKKGFKVFSPITYGHMLRQHVPLPDTEEFWLSLDFDFLRRSEAMYILCLEGWMLSSGLEKERRLCNVLDIPIAHYKHKDDEFHLMDEHWSDHLVSIL